MQRYLERVSLSFIAAVILAAESELINESKKTMLFFSSVAVVKAIFER
jgi:hypothetical protein